jgi:hypothetical protein
MLLLWCPGCDNLHAPNVLDSPEPVWQWNGDLVHPTLHPSILTHMSDVNKCHCFLTNGQWHFLGDSYHHLANQVVDMVPLPQWIL